MKLHSVKKGQIWRSKGREDLQIEICGKTRDKWRTRILTNKPGVYHGSHTMSDYTLYKRFNLQ